MKRKILALLLSLAMLLSVGGMVEGTLAVGISVDSTRSSVTLGEVDPVVTPASEDEPTVEPEGTPEATPTPTVESEATVEPTPAPTEEPEATVEPTPAPTVEPEATVEPTPAPTVEPTPVPEEEAEHIKGCFDGCTAEGCACTCHAAQKTPADAYNYLVLIQDDEKATKDYLDTLTDEQILALISYLETQEMLEGSLPYLLAYLELRFPPYEFLSCVNDTVAAPLVQSALPRRMMFRMFAAPKNDSGLETSKSVVMNADGSYTLRLEAYATGATYTTETSKPTDIVLVLDTSGSMDEYISVADKNSVANLDPKYADYYKWNGGLIWHDMRYRNGKWQYDSLFGWKDCGDSWFGNSAGIKKIDALKIAVDGFLDSTAQNSGDDRVALVTYASEASTQNGLTNNFDTIKEKVWNLNANGATRADYGMAKAKDVLDGIPANRDSNKVVIMFTDGEPTSGNTFETKVANDTISISKQMKDAGVTVYTVGVTEGANNADTSSRFNKYMNYVSSNYPDAESMSSGGEKYEHPDGGNYYLTADNLEALKEIFQSISNEVGGASNSTLDSQTVLKDIISDSFQLPDGADAGSIAVYTADCTAINNGIPTFGADQSSELSASIAEDGRTITVSGFDYSANYVGQNTTTGVLHNPGKKLIVEIPIVVRTGFLGGNNVPTNGDTSGVYDKDGNSVEKFVVPTVNVPIKDVTVTAADKNVYLLGGLTAAQLKEGAEVKVGDVELKLNETNYGLETWQTEYVNITDEVKDKDGNVITGLTDLTADTTYTISVTVAPKTNGAGASGTANSMDGKTGSDDASINVFKPELTFEDSEVYYGAVAPAAPTDYSNLTATVWKHENTLSTAEGVTMIGAAPELTLTYTPDSTKIADGKVNTKQDIAVDVAVKIGETNVTGHTTFVHTKCADDNTCTDPANGKFWLHVKTCQLTITKTGEPGKDLPDEPFVFTVKKDGVEYTEATIVGNGSVTICELPVGTYTIAEDTGWSWRFTADNGSAAELSATNPTGTVTCRNAKTLNYWLNGFSAVVTNIFGVKH